MTGDDEPTPDAADVLQALDRKLDTIAAALAAVASSHTDLLQQVRESEARRTEDALDVAQRLDALERQVLHLQQQPSAPAGGTTPSSIQEDMALALDVLARIAESVERADARTEDRLAALRDAAAAPVTDLHSLLAGRADRTEARLDELGEQLADHTDSALAGMLRLLDARLATVRGAIEEMALVAVEPTPPPPPAAPSFEAGAVMGAAQAAWNRLEQRLDTEFDDLARQLQTMTTLVEQALSTAEAAANRPVVTSDQLRKTATSVKDAVLSASRARRERHGRPRGLGPGPGPGSGDR